MGNENFTAVPVRHLPDRDRHINIAANKQEQYEKLCDLIGGPDLKTDPRFAERQARKTNRDALTPILEEKLATRPTDYWVETLNEADVPSGAISRSKTP